MRLKIGMSQTMQTFRYRGIHFIVKYMKSTFCNWLHRKGINWSKDWDGVAGQNSQGWDHVAPDSSLTQAKLLTNLVGIKLFQ